VVSLIHDQKATIRRARFLWRLLRGGFLEAT
jgi:hypothetical protein